MKTVANDSSDGCYPNTIGVLYQYALSFNSSIEIDHNADMTCFWIRRKGDGNMWFDLKGTKVLVSYWTARTVYDMNNQTDLDAVLKIIRDTIAGDLCSVKICDLTFE